MDFIVDTLTELVPGSELETASNGYDGLLKVGTFGPDLLILDLRMPGLDGLEVCRRIKANPAIRATQILMITAFAEKGTAKEARQAGADGFLRKPLRLDALTTQVERMRRRAGALRPGGRSPRRSS